LTFLHDQDGGARGREGEEGEEEEEGPALNNADFRSALLPFLSKPRNKHEEDEDDDEEDAVGKKKKAKKAKKRQHASGVESDDSDGGAAAPDKADKGPAGGLMLRKGKVKASKKASSKSEYKIKF